MMIVAFALGWANQNQWGTSMTVYDYIRQRWPNHAQRIIEAARQTDRASAEYALTQPISDKWIRTGVLGALFIWEQTPEGHAYWKALSESGEEVRL